MKYIENPITVGLGIFMMACSGGGDFPERLEISSESDSIAAGQSLQYKALAHYGGNAVRDITELGVWSTRGENILEINDRGYATSFAKGSTSVQFEYGGLAETSALTVRDAELESITASAPETSLAKGSSVQLIAMGEYTDGSERDLTNEAVWLSTDYDVLDVSNSHEDRGVAFAAMPGSARIAAVHSRVTSNETTISVSEAALISMDLTLPGASLPVGTSSQVSVLGTFSDGSVQNLTRSVSWRSTDESIVDIIVLGPSRGTVSARSMGRALILAQYESMIATLTIDVAPARIVSLSINPHEISIPAGSNLQMTATGMFSDSSERDVSHLVSWFSSEPEVADISNEGVAATNRPGRATIAATLDGVQGYGALTVD